MESTLTISAQVPKPLERTPRSVCCVVQTVSRQADAVLTHLCFHDSLGRQLGAALRTQPSADDGTDLSPPLSPGSRTLEMMLRRLAVACAEAEPPYSEGTAQGGVETMQWLVEEVATSAQRWQAAIAHSNGGVSEQQASAETSEAALEV